MAIRKSLCLYDNKGNWIIPKNGKPKYLDGWDKIKCSRINKIKKFNAFDVFYEGATLGDIKQGGIGDCYFLSAIGSLTNFPNFIESHFYLEDEKKHIYGIYFFINGRWKRVLVDDQFPCRMNDKNIFGELYFSCSFQNEIWVSLYSYFFLILINYNYYIRIIKINAFFFKKNSKVKINRVFDLRHSLPFSFKYKD